MELLNFLSIELQAYHHKLWLSMTEIMLLFLYRIITGVGLYRSAGNQIVASKGIILFRRSDIERLHYKVT